ncbi:MAG: hypothetical protein RLZZ350_969 [Verrucomicrobiota bacterium]|jgi:hypothetical protein
MKTEQLQHKLLAAARAHAPSDRVPYAFEKRIMAHLAALPVPDAFTLWAAALLRSAGVVAAFVLLLGAVSYFTVSEPAAAVATATPSSSNEELSVQLESTLLAAVDSTDNSADELQ